MGSPLRRSIFSIFGSLVTTLIEPALWKSVDQGTMETDSVLFARECVQNKPHTDTFNPTSRIPSAAHFKARRGLVIGRGRGTICAPATAFGGAMVTTGSAGPAAGRSRFSGP